MRRFCLFLLLFYLVSATSLARGQTNPYFTIPQGAFVIVSEWSLDGDTPKGLAKEIKVGPPRVELEESYPSRITPTSTGLGKHASCLKGVTFAKGKRTIKQGNSICFFLVFLLS
jgi:hypothetical protein